MPALDRRTLLKGAGVAAAASALTGPAFSSALAVSAEAVFQYGVASGDPLPDGIVLWTRVTPTPAATPGSGLGRPVNVTWVVAEDAALTQVVRRGTVVTTAARDHTVKVDIRGLAADQLYHYGFTALGAHSRVGRTRTAPAADARNERLRFGMVSCSNYTGGYFSAYRWLAQRDDLDFVLHLGDYLYEYGNGEGRYGPATLVGKRDHDPAGEMLTLSDYRRRHALYKADPDLGALHATYAFITTWDDHEVTNDSWREGAQNHSDAEGNYVARRNRAYQVYDEWMPIRLPAQRTEAGMRIYRRLRFGTLADLTMLDLRQYRDVQLPNTDGAGIDDPQRTMTGPEQQAFLEDGLTRPGSPAWRLFGNPVQIMQVKAPPLPAAMAAAVASLQGAPTPVSVSQSGFALLVDPWDGYTANRQRILDVAHERGVGDPVFLTGDIHSTWAADLPVDPGTYIGSPSAASPSAGIELVCPSVTSDNLDEITGSPPRTASVAVESAIKAANRHIKEVEFDSHGYSVVDVTREGLQFDTWFISDREDPAATQQFFRGFTSRHGSRSVVPAAGPMPTPPSRSTPPVDRGRGRPAPAADSSEGALAATGTHQAIPVAGLAGVLVAAVALRHRGRSVTAAQSPTLMGPS